MAAQHSANAQIRFVVEQARFFDRFKDQLNERQLKAVRRMLAEGPEGFVGGMSAKKYVAITNASRATATRDLQELARLGALVQTGEGRGVRYVLPFLKDIVP